MNRTAFILLTAIVLILAFGLGWMSHWLVHRFARVPGDEIDEVDRLAQDLHDAEEERDAVLAEAAAQQAELASRLAQTEAELRATMEGLRDARAEAEDLRAYLEQLNARA
jgi:prophage endopeptidase